MKSVIVSKWTNGNRVDQAVESAERSIGLMVAAWEGTTDGDIFLDDGKGVLTKIGFIEKSYAYDASGNRIWDGEIECLSEEGVVLVEDGCWIVCKDGKTKRFDNVSDAVDGGYEMLLI